MKRVPSSPLARCVPTAISLSVLSGLTGLTGCGGTRPEIETAIHNGNVAGVDQLAHGDALTVQDNHGMTALTYAVWDKHPAVAKLLLERGAKADVPDDKGNTALFYAVRHNSEEMVSALLAHGANPNAPCADGVTPLSLATDRGYANIVALMKQAGGH